MLRTMGSSLLYIKNIAQKTCVPPAACITYICIRGNHRTAPNFLSLELGMERDRVRDNSSSPHPTENPTSPLIEADPTTLTPTGEEIDAVDPARSSLPPPATDSQSGNEPPPRSKPLKFQGFERPSFSRIAILTVQCFITYPAFYALTLVAKDKSLFLVRLIVSVWCSWIGFALGYVILGIGAQHLEAASESTSVGC